MLDSNFLAHTMFHESQGFKNPIADTLTQFKGSENADEIEEPQTSKKFNKFKVQHNHSFPLELLIAQNNFDLFLKMWDKFKWQLTYKEFKNIH